MKLLAFFILIVSVFYFESIGLSQNLTKGNSAIQQMAETPAGQHTGVPSKMACTSSSCAAPVVIGALVDGVTQCVDECNTGSPNGPNFVGNNCYDFPDATAWFQITTGPTTATLEITVTSADLSNPFFAVFGTANCANYTIYNGGNCYVGAAGSVTGIVDVPVNTTLLIAVSDDNGLEGDFTICVETQPDLSACNVDNELVVTNTSLGSPLTGPYLPGEVVSYCYSINQYTQANCNWLQGIVPEFGDCWDAASFDANGQPVTITTGLVQEGSFGTGGWDWWADGAVQYNTTGVDVGAGWFFSRPVGTNPNDSWGDGNGMGLMGDCNGATSGLSWSVCFDLIVRTDCENGSACNVSVKTYADGEIGNWTSLGCATDIATFQNATLVCCLLQVEAGANTSFCAPGTINLNGSFINNDGPGNVTWTANPVAAEAGLSNPNILNPTFTPPPGVSGPITFTLSVTDDACTLTDNVIITVNLTPDIDPIANVVICDSYTLPAITGTNLTGNQAYYTGPNGTGTQFNAGAAITTPGTTTLFIYDATGTTPNCFDEETFTVTINLTPVITPLANVTICNSYTLPAITGTNLTGNQAYFSGPGGTGTQFNAGTVITTPGTTTFYIYDETGTVPNCFDEETFTVTINLTPIINPLTNTLVCDSYTFPAITGTNLTGNQAYYTGPSGSGVQYNAGDVINFADFASYPVTLYIFDQTGTTPNCLDQEFFQLTIVRTPILAPVANVAVCNSYTFPAIIGTNLTGTEAYFTGPNGTGTSFLPGQTFNTVGTTTIYIYNQTGTTPNCFDEESFELTINPLPVIAGVGQDPSVCNATDGQIEVTLTSGNTSLGSLTWTGAASGTNPTADITLDSPDIDNLGAGSYNVTFTDANGCVSNTVNVALNNPGAPIINPISDYSSCNVDYELLLSNVTGTNLTANLAFYDAPDGPAGTGNVIADGTIFTAPTNITVYVYDENGTCDAEIQFQVEINENPTAIISPDPAEVCFGSTITLNGNPAGGSGVYTTNAWTGNTAIINNPNIVNPNTLATAAVGVYNLTYTVTDDNGCVGSDNIQVTINTVPVLSGTLDMCVGLTTTINSTGTPDATTPWTSSNTGVATVDASGVVTGVANGTSIITFLDANGCSSSVTVTVNANPVISLTPTDPTVCNGTDGFITVNGAGNGTVNWAGDAIGTDGPVNLPYNITALSAGNYNVVFTDGTTGCISNNPATTLNNPNAPVIDPIADTASCGVDFVVPNPATYITGADLTGNQAFYSATGGNAADLIAPGTVITAAMSPMTIFAYDINGICDSEVSFMVTVNENPIASITPDPATVCAGQDLQMNGNPTGGSGTYSTHVWTNTGSTSLDNDAIQNPLFNSVTAGNYDLTYTVTDDNGCSATDIIVVTVIASPIIDPLGPINACGTFDLPVITGVDLTGNQAYFNDTQANGGTVVTGTITSSTTLYMFDGDAGCTNEVPVVITINELPNVTSITGDGSYCEDEVPANVLVDVTGTADWIIYYTLNGVADAVVSSTSPFNLGNLEGTYILDSIADNNCSNTVNGSVVIFIKPTPGVPSAGNDSEYCSTVDFADMFANGAGGTMTWYTDLLLTEIFGTGNAIQPANQVGATSYYVTETIDGCEGPSNEVVITIENCDIILPTAFTPDNDGNNDTWEIPLLDEAYPNNVVYVYNRWGSLIFEHNSQDNGPYNANQWDGTYNGNPLPVGSYFFVIDFNNAAQESATGAVSIILN
jgi:gliding motility-associated-like protein